MYVYEKERPNLFTDEGQRNFLRIRDKVQYLLKMAGAVRAEEAMSASAGDSWFRLACLDRLVELREIYEVTDSGMVAAQDRIFVSPRRV